MHSAYFPRLPPVVILGCLLHAVDEVFNDSRLLVWVCAIGINSTEETLPLAARLLWLCCWRACSRGRGVFALPLHLDQWGIFIIS